MSRHRLVTETNGRQHVSSVVLAPDELEDTLDSEMFMHAAAGWQVTRYKDMVQCRRGEATRWIWIRTRQPEDDTL